MTRKFRNTYRVDTFRKRTWDYGWNGAYFITICTYKRERFFGKINAGKMMLSPIGEMAEKYWHEIPEHFPFVKLGAFVVMPDHVHGIIIIKKQEKDNPDGDNPDGVDNPTDPEPYWQNPAKNKFGPQSKNLASIIRGYKIGVTKNAKPINPNWKWQSRFHDSIIPDELAFTRIENYIINNPKNWKND